MGRHLLCSWAWILTLPITAGVAFGLVWGMNKIGWINF